MVIDKTNPNLISPLLGNNNKETFYQLKKEYENLLQISNQLNNNINRKKNKEDSIDIDYIKNNIKQILINLANINEILNEYFNFDENSKISYYQETKDIINKIIIEQKIIISNIKENNIHINYNELVDNLNKILNYESEFNTTTTDSDKSEIDNYTNNIIEVNEENNNNNITSHERRRKIFVPVYFNNVRVIRKNNFEYSVEESSLWSSGGKILIFCIVVLLNIFLFNKLIYC